MGMIRIFLLAVFSIAILAIEVKNTFSFLYIAFFTYYVIVHHSDIAVMKVNVRVQINSFLLIASFQWCSFCKEILLKCNFTKEYMAEKQSV